MFTVIRIFLVICLLIVPLSGCHAGPPPDLLAYQTRPLTLSITYTCGNKNRSGILSLNEAGASLQFSQPAELTGLTISHTAEGYSLHCADDSRFSLESAGNLPDLAIIEGVFTLSADQMIATETDGETGSTALYQTDFGQVSVRFQGDSPFPAAIDIPEIDFSILLSPESGQ